VRKTAAKIEVRGDEVILISYVWGEPFEDKVRPLTRDEAYRGIDPKAVNVRMVAKNLGR